MSRVFVAGEALIDLVISGESRVAMVGGGPANTARALMNLGIPISFIGGISSDEFGALISAELDGVDLRYMNRSSLPTALARVRIDSMGSPSYEFQLERTATFAFSRDHLPRVKPELLYIGSLATVIEPGASELFAWASDLGAPIVFDPNVRPSVIPAKNAYLKAVEKWARICSVIKVSDEDLKWLGFSDISHFFDLGASLVVVTRGELGIEGFTPSESVSVPGFPINVVDTVGAGDTVGAVVVEGCLQYGIDGMVGENLLKVLSRAAKAAAIACTRAGPVPPTFRELI